eukprot:SAG31_NODE_5621_length_2419_cov_4.649138_2_plen_76_part_00
MEESIGVVVVFACMEESIGVVVVVIVVRLIELGMGKVKIKIKFLLNSIKFLVELMTEAEFKTIQTPLAANVISLE